MSLLTALPFAARRWAKALLAALGRPEAMLFLPALALGALWLGGERALMGVALGLPLLAGALRLLLLTGPGTGGSTIAGRVLLPQIAAQLDQGLRHPGEGAAQTAAIVLRLDAFDKILAREGMGILTLILDRCAERLTAALRASDLVALAPDGGFAIALGGARRFDSEVMVQLCARLQAALTPAILIGQVPHYITCSAGFCIGAKAPQGTGGGLLAAAALAAEEAVEEGPAAIRAYSAEVARRRAERSALREELQTALDEGQIRPHYQPQVSTDTGAVSGFEALARWHHPVQGLVPPAQFLPDIEAAGLSERLSEVMLFHALSALAAWDRAGLSVPTVGVNFSSAELRNPRLVEKLQWELDRFELKPERLSVEILETVVAETGDDIIVRNVAALAALGCGIDLDDFGTGNASLASIRRFAVRRIKIDRSFVTRVDSDRKQQQMISALVSLADQLGLDTLAEGVETSGEHAMLAQLGCAHVQGFGIARPMPFEETEAWIAARSAALVPAPEIGQRSARR